MTADDVFDRELGAALHRALDTEVGPDPVWADAPAARRIADLDRRGAGTQWSTRILALAAVLAIGGGAAFLAGAPRVAQRLARESFRPAPAVKINGWIAFTQEDKTPAGQSDDDIWFGSLAQPARRVVGSDSDDLDEICPAFSPDGTRLAFGRAQKTGSRHEAAYRQAELVIAEIAADGRVTESSTIDVGGWYPPPCATWSPDGSRLAFGAPLTSPLNPERSAEGSEVWVVSLADLEITKLPNLLATDIAWSPDSTHLAIASGTDKPWPGGAHQDGRIYIWSRDSGRVRTLESTYAVYYLSWSPDGARIVHTGRGVGEVPADSGLYMVDVADDRDRKLTDASALILGTAPEWSAQGRIVFVVPRAVEEDVYVIDPPERLDGDTEAIAITPVPVQTPSLPSLTGRVSADRVTWSPDGQYLLFVGWAEKIQTNSMLAVPADPKQPVVRIVGAANPSSYDGYDAVVPMYDQAWGVQPDR
jgi:dipeptidyl aminopeptidase/acylaminoacyl peptidase